MKKRKKKSNNSTKSNCDKKSKIPDNKSIQKNTKKIFFVCIIIFCISLSYKLVSYNLLKTHSPVFKNNILCKGTDSYTYYDLIDKKIDKPFYYSPLYIYFVKLFSFFTPDTKSKIVYFQIILSSIAACLFFIYLFLINQKIYLSLFCSLLLGISSILTFYDFVLLPGSIMVSIICIILFLLRIYENRQNNLILLLIGIFIGLSGLGRGVNIAYLFGIISYFTIKHKTKIFRKNNVFKILIIIFGCCIIVLPIMVKNYSLGKKIVIVNSFDANYSIGNSEGSTGSLDVPEGKILKFLSISWIKLYIQKIYIFLNGYHISNNYSYYYSANQSILLKYNFLDYYFFAVLGLTGFLIILLKRKYSYIYIILIFVFYGLLTSIFFIVGRFKLPIIPVLIIGIYFLTNEFHIFLKRKKYISILKYLIIICILFYFLNGMWLKKIFSIQEDSWVKNEITYLFSKKKYYNVLELLDKYQNSLTPKYVFEYKIAGYYVLKKYEDIYRLTKPYINNLNDVNTSNFLKQLNGLNKFIVLTSIYNCSSINSSEKFRSILDFIKISNFKITEDIKDFKNVLKIILTNCYKWSIQTKNKSDINIITGLLKQISV